MTFNPNCSETYAILRLVGVQIIPSVITGVLGLQPTFQASVGDIFPKGTKPRTEGLWSISTQGQVRSSDLEEHIAVLLRKLSPEFRSLIPAECRCEIQCVWRSATGHGGPTLSATLLGQLSALGITLDFDFYSDI